MIARASLLMIRILLAAALAFPLGSASSAETFVFRFKNAHPVGLSNPDEPSCEADGSCDGVCAPLDDPASPDCALDPDDGRDETDDNDNICEIGEDTRDSDCNGICDHPDEAGSSDCADEALDHDPIDALFNADMESTSQPAWRFLVSNGVMPSLNQAPTETDKQLGGLRFLTVSSPSQPFYQDVEVPDGLEAAGFEVAYNWLQASGTPDSTGTVEAVFLDRNGLELDRRTPAVRSMLPADTWFERRATGTAPAGTRFVRIVLRAGVAGAQFDNIDLRINGVKYSTILGSAGMPERPQDRLFDASTESGPNGTIDQMFSTKWWRRADGQDQLFLSKWPNPFTGADQLRFSTNTGSGTSAEYSQMVYLGPDKGGKKLTIEWFQFGNSSRRGHVRAEFYSRYEGESLGSLSPVHAAVPDDIGTMAYRNYVATIPDGAEFVRVVLKVDRAAAVSDIGMFVGDENWSRRGVTEGSGVPTTCEYLGTYNPTFTNLGDGYGYAKYWAQTGWRILTYNAGGNTAPQMEYTGAINQALCVPRNKQKDFEGLFYAFNNIRATSTPNGGRFSITYYNKDMEVVNVATTEMAVDGGSGPGIFPHFGYVRAYGTVDNPAPKLDDISTIVIRSVKSNGSGDRETIFDNVMFADAPVALPDYEIDWEPVITAVSGSSYRR